MVVDSNSRFVGKTLKKNIRSNIVHKNRITNLGMKMQRKKLGTILRKILLFYSKAPAPKTALSVSNIWRHYLDHIDLLSVGYLSKEQRRCLTGWDSFFLNRNLKAWPHLFSFDNKMNLYMIHWKHYYNWCSQAIINHPSNKNRVIPWQIFVSLWPSYAIS